MIAVCRKELRSYRISMIGYVFIAFMLAVVSLYFAYQNLKLASPRFELVLQNVQFIFLVFVPILTMRVLAEEKKQKTDQLLLTLPMTVKDIVIYNARTREVMRINTDFIQTLTGQAYGAGDDIIINTKRGEKSVTLLRAGLTTNILNCLGKGSSWFQLSKGDNIFIYNATEGAMSIQFKIENDTIYEGV